MGLTSSELNHLRTLAVAHTEAVVALTQRICVVPAPTGDEQRRGEFVASLLRERGYMPTVDTVGNVYARRGRRGTGPILLLLAHLDTVFPLSTPLKIERNANILRGPGIGDNCLSIAAMLGVLDILDAMNQETAADIVVVADVGEEGLGNLRGARAAVERYRDELGAVIALDGNLGRIVNSAVGSKRWRITVHGPGGHSFGAFGLPSAIHGLSKIITAITELQVPQNPKTTYNVGLIEGGSSVNTIAAHASALLDMRSTDVAALDHLAEQVRTIVLQGGGDGLRTEIEVVGERPAGSRDLSDPLLHMASQALTWLGYEPVYVASSTDVNISISLNIPSVCIGITQIHQSHTVEEWLTIPPIGDGLAQAVRLCLEASAWLIAQSEE